MLNILNKIFFSSKNTNIINDRFSSLKKETNVKKIFDAIENFSVDSEIRYVGGCVRKILNNEKVDDVDLATNIEPFKVKKALADHKINFHETGLEHGTITAIIEKEKFEITSLRRDIKTDGRHAKIEFTDNWVKDAERRDFTINAIYSDINGNLFDPFDGKKDLENGIVKFVGNTEKRIKEDYLRILRYFRFFSIYSKREHLTDVKTIIKKNIAGIKKLSSERLIDEFKKIYTSNSLFKISHNKFSLELIKIIFPEFLHIDIFKKLNNFAKENIHNIDFCLILSILVIDKTDNLDYFLYKFNISKKDQKRMNLIKEFFFKNKENIKLNVQNLPKILYLYRNDGLNDILKYKIFTSKNVDAKIVSSLNKFKNKIPPSLPINGDDLIQKFGIKEGEQLGKILKEVEKFWINNNFKITDKDLKKILRH